MKRQQEKDFIRFLKTTRPYCDKQTLLSHTNCIREIRYLPNNGVLESRAYLMYDKFGNIMCIYNANNSNYISLMELRNALPKRISVIRDWTRMSQKDYNKHLKDFYSSNS